MLAKNRSETLPAPSENPWERCWSEIELRGCTAEKAAAGQKVLEAWGGLSIVKPAERLSGCEEWIYWFNQQCAMNCVLGTGHRGHHLTSVPTLRGLKVLHRWQVNGQVIASRAKCCRPRRVLSTCRRDPRRRGSCAESSAPSHSGSLVRELSLPCTICNLL